jgi:hypothetical protein
MRTTGLISWLITTLRLRHAGIPKRGNDGAAFFGFDQRDLGVEQADDGSGLHLHTRLREVPIDELLMSVA